VENINILKQSLEQQKVSLSRYGIDLLCRLILALIQTRCVNLQKVAAALYGPAQVDSHYRRLQRFFAQQISPEIFAALILERIAKEGQHLYLSLDRTHWKLGKTHQNILGLGLLFQGVSIPFMYEVLGKAGNANTDERKRLMKKILKYLKGYSGTLLADREFIGKAWFTFLLKQKNMDFVIRIKSNSWIRLKNGRETYVDRRSPGQRRNTTKTYEAITLYGSLSLNLICHRPPKEERVYLVTNHSGLNGALKRYGKRWPLETTFGFLKSRGFDLESTHLTDPKRLKMLIGVLTLCLLWGLRVGEVLNQKKPITCKKHGRKAISLFRLGLDYLHHLINNSQHQSTDFRSSCRLLVSCT